MSKYVIHACPDRMWYVNGYLIPSMKEQGINEIMVKCDKGHYGCLENCMQAFMGMYGPGGAWHMQDDVLVCRNFKERTEEFKSGIVCGFVFEYDEWLKYTGTVTPEHMWWSFPCIYIPNELARECAKWFYTEARKNPKYEFYLKSGKYDDYFFLEFLKERYPKYQVLNLKPCLVDHVDYLIGGSVVNNLASGGEVELCIFGR